MNPQYFLLCVISGLYVSQIWHFLLTSPSLWRKRKGLDEEQRARLYFFRAMAIIVSLIMAYLLGTLLEGTADEQVMAYDYTLLITGMGVVPCLLGSWTLLVQRKRETPEYDGLSAIAIGLFTLVMNFLIS
jgi:undecaprenyl pyrophosphate phosphatase UppP